MSLLLSKSNSSSLSPYKPSWGKAKSKMLFTILLFLIPFIMPLRVMADETISNIIIEISPGEDDIQSGKLYSGVEPIISSSGYEMSYSVSSGKKKAKNSYTYTLTFTAITGTTFSDDCIVTVKGATAVTVTSRSANTVKAKATTYPFYAFPAVENVHRSGSNYVWDKSEHADGYDIIIFYDNDGEEKEKKTSSKTPRINVSSYEKSNRSLNSIAIRPKVNGAMSGFFAAKYTDENGDGVDTDDSSATEYVFNPPTARSNGSSTGSGGSTSTATGDAPSVSNNATAGVSNGMPVTGNSGGPGITANNPVENSSNWQIEGEDWYYVVDGEKKTGWVNPINNDWYLMDSDGKMLTGWQDIEGQRYYFKTTHDGTYGKMLTGWQNLGAWYFFNDIVSGSSLPYGALFRDMKTPDGRSVNSEGKWIG